MIFLSCQVFCLVLVNFNDIHRSSIFLLTKQNIIKPSDDGYADNKQQCKLNYAQTTFLREMRA